MTIRPIFKRLRFALFSLSSLLLALIFELIASEASVKRYFYFSRNIFLVLFAVFAALALFFLLKKRFGAPGAVICTILIVSAVVFLVGAAFIAASLLIPQSASYTAIHSLYHYLLGIVIVLASVCMAVLDLFAFIVIKIVVFIKNKHRKFN